MTAGAGDPPVADEVLVGRVADSARMFGKYLGACAATAIPVALVYLIVGVTFAIWRGRPSALLWAAATEVESQFPSLAASVLSLTMDYPQHVFFGSRDPAGPFQGAALNVLRPEPTVGTALLSLALILTIAAAVLAAARALRFRASE